MQEPPSNRIVSWGEIAKYLRCHPTTAMIWAKERGLPVHHVPGGKHATVFALKEELDCWLLSAGTNGQVQGGGEKGVAAGLSPAKAPVMEGASQLQTRRLVLRYGVGFVAVAAVVGLTYFLVRPQPAPRVVGYSQITNDGRNKTGEVFTDGTQLYFVETLAQGEAIVQQALTGGEAQPLSTFLTKPAIQGLSRRRAELLVIDPSVFGAQRPALWALPLSGGPPRRVGNIFADAAEWSPDGNSIAYSAGPNLYISKSDGTESRKIAEGKAIITDICWSPNGKLLRFTSSFARSGNSRIWEVRPDGSDLHPLFAQGPHAEGAMGGAWTPDGKYFLFTAGWDVRPQLWVLSEARGALGWGGSVPVQFSTGPLRVGSGFPSLDGGRVFILSDQTRADLLRFDKISKEFVPYLAGVSASELSFSRDGQWAAYAEVPDNHLWRRRTDGSRPLELTFSPMIGELPRWSPDGEQIAFMGQKTRRDLWQVYLISADGGGYHPVLPAPYPQGAPTWSPDGTQLAFGELPINGAQNAERMAIHVVNLRTHEGTTLPGSTGLWTARWSPDGERLAALTTDSRTIMVFDFRRQGWEKIATAGGISDLNWTRHSDAIYFEDLMPPDGPAIFRVQLRGGRVEKVASLKREPPISSPWIGLTPDDSLLLSNSVARSEIYALDWEAP